jgi:hypothetical protein
VIGLRNVKVDEWGGTNYLIPKPYLRTRGEFKVEEGKRNRFVEHPGDGPSFKMGKAEKTGKFYHINKYAGKEGNEPPHSYLKYNEWKGKKEQKKTEEVKGEKKKTDSGRGTFIDAIFFYGNKHNFPGPDCYFKKDAKKDKKPPKVEEGKEKKKFERLNFLCDAEYLGMNNPCPGTYNFKDRWPGKNAKKKNPEEEKKKPGYKPGSWKVANDKGQAPGQYDVLRLMSIAQVKDGEKAKVLKKFASIPTIPRVTLGLINKKHETKRTLEATPIQAEPGTYFKEKDQLAKTHRKLSKPMRKY